MIASARAQTKARPFLTGLNFSEQSLARIHTDDPSIARVQQNSKRVAMAAAEICVGPAATLDYPNAIETAVTQDGTAFTAADPGADGEAIAVPIWLRIPEAAEIEAERIVLVPAALVLTGIKLPITLGLPHLRLIRLIPRRLVLVLLIAGLLCIALVLLTGLVHSAAALVRVFGAIVILIAIAFLGLCVRVTSRSDRHQRKR